MKRLLLIAKGAILSFFMLTIGACHNDDVVVCMYGGPEIDWDDSPYVNDTDDIIPEVHNTNIEQK